MDFLGRSPKTKGQRVGNHSRAGSGIDQPQARSRNSPHFSAENARDRSAHIPEVFGDPHPPTHPATSDPLPDPYALGPSPSPW